MFGFNRQDKQLLGEGFGLSLLIILIVGALLMSMTSCMTTEKATRFLINEGTLDDQCAKYYPVMPEEPDTNDVFKPAVDSSIIVAIRLQRDSALKRLGYLEAMGKKLDSNTCAKLVDDYINTVADYEFKLYKVQEELEKAKVRERTITKKFIDSAALSALRGKYENLATTSAATIKSMEQKHAFQLYEAEKKLKEKSADADKWQGKAKDLKGTVWKLYAFIIACLALLIIKVAVRAKTKGIAGVLSMLNPIKLFT